MNTVKKQRDFTSINCLSTVNETFHLYFYSHIDANVWKTACTAPGPETQIFQDNSQSKCDMFSENIRIPYSFIVKKMK